MYDSLLKFHWNNSELELITIVINLNKKFELDLHYILIIFLFDILFDLHEAIYGHNW